MSYLALGQTTLPDSGGGLTGVPIPNDVYIPFSNSYGVQDRAAEITVTYVGIWEQPQIDAFEFAVSIWESILESEVDITVVAQLHSWPMMENKIAYGYAVEKIYDDNDPNYPELIDNTMYPGALANKLVGSNIGTGFNDIYVALADDEGFPNGWYYKTDGNCPESKYDFVTAALKSIAHGLGIQILGAWSSPGPFINERFVFNHPLPGVAYVSFYPYQIQPGSEEMAYLTSDNLFWKGPNPNSTGAKLYAPSIYDPWSSLSTLDENTYNGTINALMTPFIGLGEAIHDPGPITIGMLKDIGWDDLYYPTSIEDELKIRGFNWQAFQNNGWYDSYFNTPIVNVEIGDHLGYANEFIDNAPYTALAWGTTSWKLEVNHQNGWYEHVSEGDMGAANYNGKFFDFILDDLPPGYNWSRNWENKVIARIVLEIDDYIGGYTNREELNISINYKPNKPTLNITNLNSINCSSAALSFYARGAESYTILHTKLDDNIWSQTLVPPGSTSCSIYGLLEDKKYLFVVQAVNSAGESISDPVLRDNCKFSVISYPNPAINDVKVSSLEAIALEKAEVKKLSDPTILRTEYGDGYSTDIDVQMQNLPSGLYKLDVKDIEGKSSSQIIMKF